MDTETIKQHLPALIILGVLLVLVVVMAIVITRVQPPNDGSGTAPGADMTETDPEQADPASMPRTPPPSIEERQVQVEDIKEEENPAGLSAEERRAQSAELEAEQNPNGLSREERQAQIDAMEGR